MFNESARSADQVKRRWNDKIRPNKLRPNKLLLAVGSTTLIACLSGCQTSKPSIYKKLPTSSVRVLPPKPESSVVAVPRNVAFVLGSKRNKEITTVVQKVEAMTIPMTATGFDNKDSYYKECSNHNHFITKTSPMINSIGNCAGTYIVISGPTKSNQRYLAAVTLQAIPGASSSSEMQVVKAYTATPFCQNSAVFLDNRYWQTYPSNMSGLVAANNFQNASLTPGDNLSTQQLSANDQQFINCTNQALAGLAKY